MTKLTQNPKKPAKTSTAVNRRFDLTRCNAREWLTALERSAALGIFDAGTGRRTSRTGREVAEGVAFRWQVGQEVHLRAAYQAGRYQQEHVAQTRDERPPPGRRGDGR